MTNSYVAGILAVAGVQQVQEYNFERNNFFGTISISVRSYST